MAPWILLGIGAGALYLIFRPKASVYIPPSASPGTQVPPASHPTILSSTGLSPFDVQQALNLLGYNVSADGVWGSQTEAAVRKFQADHGLTPDGVVGPQTSKALDDAMVEQGIATDQFTP